MGRSTRPADDGTGDAATGNVAGDMILSSVLATQNDELDQVLILTHLALGIPLPPLARDLKTDRQELESRAARILTELSLDAGLSARLSGIRRAGQIEHYYPIIARLGLRNWFCACPGCPNLVVQPETGRPRRTCSSRCRRRLNRGSGISPEDRRDDGSPVRVEMEDAEVRAAEDAIVIRNFMLRVMRPLNFPRPATRWSLPNIHCRDRALLLLGLTCPVPITITDLRNLDIDDIGETSKGAEVRLYKRHKIKSTRYITIPASDDSPLCVGQALLSWRRLLTRNGRTAGPLFIRLEPTGKLPGNSTRLGADAVTKLVYRALWESGIDNERLGLRASMPLSDFLGVIMAPAGFRETVLKFEPEPDRPLGPDPCEPRYASHPRTLMRRTH